MKKRKILSDDGGEFIVLAISFLVIVVIVGSEITRYRVNHGY